MKQTTTEAGEPQAAAPQVHSPAHEPRHCAVPQTPLQSAAAPGMKVPDGKAIAFDHPDSAVGEVRLMAALGTTDRDLCRGIVEQLGDAASYGRDEQALDFMLSVVKSIKPRDQVETMLAVQMAEVHMATLTSARLLARATAMVQQEYAERALNKLARTFATQTEALRRYRSCGEPNVTVRHVSVSDGGQAIVGQAVVGQAIVGNVTQAPRDTAPRAKPTRAAPAGATPRTAAAAATPAGATSAGATSAGAVASRGARPRTAAPKPPPISPLASADAPMMPPRRAEIAPAPKRRAR
jgi:hypothetical protein